MFYVIRIQKNTNQRSLLWKSNDSLFAFLLYTVTFHSIIFSLPGRVINNGGISVDSPDFFHKCFPHVQKSNYYNANAKPQLEQIRHSPI